jgi:WD40 repeat protein
MADKPLTHPEKEDNPGFFRFKVWNVAAGRLLLTLPGHNGSVNGLAFRADGRVLASCSDSEIRLWHAATDEEVARRSP